MQGSTRKISSALGVAALALVFSGYASAKGHGSHASDNIDPYVKRTEVAYSDLDLRHLADATQLYSRIERAARSVCRLEHGPSASAYQRELQCTQKSVEDAVQRVSNSNLTAVHQARSAKRSMVASSR